MHQSHDDIGRLYPVNLFWHYFPSLVGNQWKTFKDQISDAVKSYTPCNAANCRCHLRWMWDANVLCFLCHTLKINSYCCINHSEGLTNFSLWRSSFCLSVLQDDLQPFRGKISEDVMAATLERGVGTHYQIIGHKLYREHNCMFPAR